jgi:hypothetical protein
MGYPHQLKLDEVPDLKPGVDFALQRSQAIDDARQRVPSAEGAPAPSLDVRVADQLASDLLKRELAENRLSGLSVDKCLVDLDVGWYLEAVHLKALGIGPNDVQAIAALKLAYHCSDTAVLLV